MLLFSDADIQNNLPSWGLMLQIRYTRLVEKLCHSAQHNRYFIFSGEIWSFMCPEYGHLHPRNKFTLGGGDLKSFFSPGYLKY